MISAWWLLLIIPASALFGYILGGLFSSNAMADRCEKCQYNYYFKEEETK